MPMARRTAPPQPQPANFSVEQMSVGITRLNRRIAELEAFDPRSVQKRFAPEVAAIETSIEESLAAVFGHNTVEYNRYRGAARLDRGPMSVALGSRFRASGENLHEVYRYLAEGKQRSILLLKQAVRGLEEEIGDRAELAPAPGAESAPADEPVPDAALVAIRAVLEDIKGQLPGLAASNAEKSEIHADITQIEVEAERPTPRRRFLKLYLESLRDNIAKAAGLGTATALVTAVGAILAKFFGVF
jgi:hypothetical protein